MRDEGSHRHATGDRGPERGRWEVEGAWRYRGLVTVEPSRGCHTVLEASPDTEPMLLTGPGLDWIPRSYCTFVWLHPSADRGQRAVASSSFRAQEAARLRFLALI